MSTKFQAKDNDKPVSKKWVPHSAAQNSETLPPQPHLGPLLHRVQFASKPLTPNEVLQLQRTIGNQAVGRILAKPPVPAAQTKAVTLQISARVKQPAITTSNTQTSVVQRMMDVDDDSSFQSRYQPGDHLQIPVDQLYFRYWGTTGQVSANPCEIRGTPHYRFALAYLHHRQQNLLGPQGVPQGTDYGRYAQWEHTAMHGQNSRNVPPMHSENKFKTNLDTWIKLVEQSNTFDLTPNPIDVVPFDNNKFYITDGAHRAVFAAALLQINGGQHPYL